VIKPFSIKTERYLRIAENVQKTSLEPTVKSLILIGIVAASIVTFILVALAYTAIIQGDAPTFVYVLLPLFIAIEVAVIATLIRALRKAPKWLRRFERRFLEPT
jgi:hypothetical protein